MPRPAARIKPMARASWADAEKITLWGRNAAH
jgi:hypothetical protein